MNLRIFDDVNDLVKAAARTIVQRASQRDATSIALSGGNTPKPVYELLGSSPMREELSSREVTWVVVDELFVPFDDPQSNAVMMQKTLFANGQSPAHRFLPFHTDVGDPQKSADRFETDWRELGLGDLDVILLGMGDDGHTASLFPGTGAIDVEDRIATPVFVKRMNSWRVTLTKPVIRAAALRIVLTAGASKREMLRQIREGADYPIALVTRDVETWWFVDKAAAGE
ncbi:MAG: 6-phosphogluconolactonase [Thermoanaerobaculia bacterium]